MPHILWRNCKSWKGEECSEVLLEVPSPERLKMCRSNSHSNDPAVCTQTPARVAGARKASILNRVALSDFQSSTKIEALREELHRMLQRDPSAKALVFSQFTSMLDLIFFRLQQVSRPCCSAHAALHMLLCTFLGQVLGLNKQRKGGTSSTSSFSASSRLIVHAALPHHGREITICWVL